MLQLMKHFMNCFKSQTWSQWKGGEKSSSLWWPSVCGGLRSLFREGQPLTEVCWRRESKLFCSHLLYPALCWLWKSPPSQGGGLFLSLACLNLGETEALAHIGRTSLKFRVPMPSVNVWFLPHLACSLISSTASLLPVSWTDSFVVLCIDLNAGCSRWASTVCA